MQLLIILNLVMTVLLVFNKLKRSKILQGHLFTNMVKINLFLANRQSYVPLELNSAVGNVHLFKLSGALDIENFTLRNNWLWDVLEINWNNVHASLNDKQISLPRTLTIPLVYKLKVRKLLTEKNSLHVHIMLKHRKSWYNLESEQDSIENPPIYMWQVHIGGGTGTLDKLAGSHTRLVIYPTLTICYRRVVICA